MTGAPSGTHGSSTGVQVREAATITTTIVPMAAPMTPPMSPRVVLSTRNCPAMCRRAAPRERRRPISPTRSRTDTSVTLAMPIAPTSRETAPSSRNSEFRSFCTPALIRRGSAGPVTLSAAGPPGLRAGGIWAAMRVPACGVAGVRQAAGRQGGPHRPVGARGRRFQRELEHGLASRVVHRDRPDELAVERDVGEGAGGHDAVEAHHALLGVPREVAHRGLAGVADLGGGGDVGGVELAEPADDLVPGRLR